MVLTSHNGECKSRACALPLQSGSALGDTADTFAFTSPMGLVDPMTRAHDRLLGPCFKTGQVDHRPTRRKKGNFVPAHWERGHINATTVPLQCKTVSRPARTSGGPRTQGTVPPTEAIDSHETGCGDLLEGKSTPGDLAYDQSPRTNGLRHGRS